MRLIVWYLSVLVVIAIASVAFTDQMYADTRNWVGSDIAITKLGRGIELSDTSAPCNGVEGSITIDGYDDRLMACIFGSTSTVRVARYTYQSVFLYAVAFPSENTYSRVEGLCSGMYTCSYAPSSDAFVMHYFLPDSQESAVLYQHFSRSLISRRTSLGVMYRFIPKARGFELSNDKGVLPVYSSAFSNNGKWLVVEAPGVALLRIEVDTLETSYVTPPDSRYYLDNNPNYELSITDDGRYVAVGGFGLGLDVIEVTDQCRAMFSKSNTYEYSGATRCEYAQINPYGTFPDFVAARRLHFKSDGSALSAMIFSTKGITKVIMQPGSHFQVQQVDYVALGDSFSSGEGEVSDDYYEEGTNNQANRCHVSIRSYPYVVGRDWRVATRNIACSGAKIADVLSPLNTKSQFEQLKALQPKIISVGIGGNDAGMMDKLKSCVWVGTCEWAKDTKLRASVWREIYSVGEKLQQLIDQIHLELPDSRIILMSYPRLIAGYERAHCDTLTELLLNAAERRFIDEAVHYLNIVIRSVRNISFGDMQGAFMGEELCNGQSLAMNGVRAGDDIAPIKQLPLLKVIGAESFHPTPYGHALLAEQILRLFPDSGSVTQCLYCGTLEVVPPQYWQGGDGTPDQPQLIADMVMTSPSYQKGDSAEVTTGPYFSPSASLKIELHSDPHLLLQTTANEDGSLSTRVVIPSDIEVGYHTVHIFGEARSGKVLDVYQTIWVGDRSPPTEPLQTARIPGPSSTPNILTSVDYTNSTVSIPNKQPKIPSSLQVNKAIKGAKSTDYSYKKEIWGIAVVLGIAICITSILICMLLYRKRHRKV